MACAPTWGQVKVRAGWGASGTQGEERRDPGPVLWMMLGQCVGGLWKPLVWWLSTWTAALLGA